MTSIAADLNLCPTPQNSTDWLTVVTTIEESYWLLSQFDYGVSLGASFIPNSLLVVINKTLPLTNPVDVLKVPLQLYFDQSPCVDWVTGLASAHGSIEVGPFEYLTCSYFPLSSSEVGPGTIFPERITGDRAGAAACKAMFNITMSTQAELQKRYHFAPADVISTGRILFVVNEYDPTTACTPLYLWESSQTGANYSASRMLYIENSGHGEDSFPPTFPGMRESVLQAQNEELQSITEWLGTS